jgi:beta-glucanase (GH16 family)
MIKIYRLKIIKINNLFYFLFYGYYNKNLNYYKKMKNFLFLTLLISIYTTVPGSYKLVWSDEFEGASIDGSKWGYDIGGGGWGNNELEYYTNRGQNAYVSDGKLHIKAIKESYEGKDYTSARMLTKGKFEFQYGYVEARIALPLGMGIWPAFWMLGQNIDAVSWPTCGEIDIIEAINTENKVYATCHWFANGGHAEYGKSTGTFDITQFHTYTLYWDKEYIRVGVDGVQYYEIFIKDGTGSTGAFHNKFFFILNVAVGGNWPGFNINNDQFPNEMVVDYIRVYQP